MTFPTAPIADGEVVRATGNIDEARAAEAARLAETPKEAMVPQAPTTPPVQQLQAPPPPAAVPPVPAATPAVQPAPAAAEPAPAPVQLDPATLLAEKFGGDVTKLTQAYAELEHAQSTRAAEPTAPGAPFQLDKAPATPAVDFAAIQQEYIANGEFSAESQASMIASGIPQEQIDQHRAGLDAQRELAIIRMNNILGGDEQFPIVQQWAITNLSEAEVDQFNAELASGVQERSEFAMKNLVERFKGSPAGQQTILEGRNGSAAGGLQPFRSRAEMMGAQRDPRYLKDDAYMEQFTARVNISNVDDL